MPFQLGAQRSPKNETKVSDFLTATPAKSRANSGIHRHILATCSLTLAEEDEIFGLS